MDAKPRLLDRVRNHLRKLHYSYRTEQQYLFWIRRFILFHGKRHPSDMAAREVEDFLTHLAVDRKVSASTQNQALAAILFLYQKVMQVELPWLDGIVRAKQSRYLPVVLTSTEVRAVLAHLKGEYWLGRECGAESFGSVSANATRRVCQGNQRREGDQDCARFATARPVGATAMAP